MGGNKKKQSKKLSKVQGNTKQSDSRQDPSVNPGRITSGENSDRSRKLVENRNTLGSSEGGADDKDEVLNSSSMVENSEQEVPASETLNDWQEQEACSVNTAEAFPVEQQVSASESSIPWCDQEDSFETSSGTPEMTYPVYNVEDASKGIMDMGFEQSNLSRPLSNIAHGKNLNNSQKFGWGKEHANNRSYNRQSGRNSRGDKNERYDGNQTDIWRAGNTTTKRDSQNYTEPSRTPRTDTHEAHKTRSNFHENKTRSNTNGDNARHYNNKGTSRTHDANLHQVDESPKNQTNFHANEQRSDARDGTSAEFRKESSRSYSGNYYSKNIFSDNSDQAKKDFNSYLESRESDNFKKVQEEERDLFNVGKDYALAHCVAEDMNMGSGIAVEFRYRFKKVAELLNQNAPTGGLAFIKDGDRFIYYLVTKARSRGKPTYDTLWSSLIQLRTHMKAHKVKKLATPRIGCGLDRLDWKIVKPMLEFLFRDEESEILVCNLQVEGNTTTYNSKKSRIIYATKAVTEIEPQTIIIYLASKDGKPSDEMSLLDKKFNFANNFFRAPKNIGETVRLVPTNPKNYILYGCIVKDKQNDTFDFVAFDKCLRTIRKNYKMDNLYYIAFQRLPDEILNAKILNLMKYCLSDLEIHICGSTESYSNIEE